MTWPYTHDLEVLGLLVAWMPKRKTSNVPEVEWRKTAWKTLMCGWNPAKPPTTNGLFRNWVPVFKDILIQIGEFWSTFHLGPLTPCTYFTSFIPHKGRYLVKWERFLLHSMSLPRFWRVASIFFLLLWCENMLSFCQFEHFPGCKVWSIQSAQRVAWCQTRQAQSWIFRWIFPRWWFQK